MVQMTRLATLCALLFGSCVLASAQMSAEALLKACNSKTESLQIVCSSYVEGFMDGIEASKGAREICWPKGVTVFQVVRVVTKWLNDHPEDLHHTARVEVMIALTTAFPCRN
jgi:hypothetical protein